MILPNRKLLLIHIPKTGGSSIASALFQSVDIDYKNYIKLPDKIQKKYMAGADLKHAPAFQYQSLMKNYDEYYKFAVVRCPWERFYSQYNWYTNVAGKISIEKFADMVKGKTVRQHHSQKFFVTKKNSDDIIVDDIFQFYQIEKVFENFDLTPQRKKISNRKRRGKKEIDNIVRDLYGEDIDFFGFDENGKANKNVTTL